VGRWEISAILISEKIGNLPGCRDFGTTMSVFHDEVAGGVLFYGANLTLLFGTFSIGRLAFLN